MVVVLVLRSYSCLLVFLYLQVFQQSGVRLHIDQKQLVKCLFLLELLIEEYFLGFDLLHVDSHRLHFFDGGLVDSFGHSEFLLGLIKLLGRYLFWFLGLGPVHFFFFSLVLPDFGLQGY